MKNYLQPGDKLTVPAPATVTSGSGTVIGGSLFGVATHDAANGVTCTFLTEGVVELPKLSTAVFAVGDRVAWDVSASQLISSSFAAADVLNVGVVVEAAGNPSATAKIKLTPEAAQVYSSSDAGSIANLNTWAGILATKLNADAGVTDTNYDTNPQA